MSTKRKLAPLPADYDMDGSRAELSALKERQRKIDAYPTLVQQRDELLLELETLVAFYLDGKQPSVKIWDGVRALIAKIKGEA